MGYVLVVRVFYAGEGGDGTCTRECARLALKGSNFCWCCHNGFRVRFWTRESSHGFSGYG